MFGDGRSTPLPLGCIAAWRNKSGPSPASEDKKKPERSTLAGSGAIALRLAGNTGSLRKMIDLTRNILLA